MTATETAMELARVAAQAAADKLAKDILLVDVSDRLAITDVFVIVTGANERQVGAIVDAVEEKMRAAGSRPPRREGERDGRWVLLDFVDVVVHVQHAEERVFYALDRLWKDCPTMPFVDAALEPTRPGRNRRRGPRCDGGSADDAARRRGVAVTLEHLILLRHGQTDWNRDQRLQGHRDIALNAVGSPPGHRCGSVDRRPARRRSSCRPTSAGPGNSLCRIGSHRYRADGRQAAAGDVDGAVGGTDPGRGGRQWPGEWDRWRTTSAHAAPPEGESRWQVAQRAKEVVDELDAWNGRPGPARLARWPDRRPDRVSAGAARGQLGHADRRRQLPLGRAAPVRRSLAAAFLQRGPGRGRAARGEDEVAGT